MTISGGKLMPASAWDAERLSSYRNGSAVSVIITQEVASWARRRYWAILGVVVKTCKVPDRVRTPQDLHDAIRKQIGFVDSHSSDGKVLTVKLRSTSKLDDQQFEAFAAEAYAELTEMTGVDVMTLGKESPDVGHRGQQGIAPPAGETIRSAQDEAMGPASVTGQSPVDAGHQQSAAAGRKEEGVSADATAPSSDLTERMRDCLRRFIGVVTDKDVPDPKDRQANLKFAKDVWKDALKERPEFVKACTDWMNKVILGKVTIEDARRYLEGLIR